MARKRRRNEGEGTSSEASKRSKKKKDKPISTIKPDDFDMPKKKPSPAWNEKEKENLEILNGVNIATTRFADKEVLKEIGIYKEVREFLTNMGCVKLLDMNAITYPDVTRHFLATLKVEYQESTPIIGDDGEEEEDMRDSQGEVRFRIGHRNFTRTIEDVCKALGFANGNFRSFGRERMPTNLWSKIGDDKRYDAKKVRVNLVRNPVVRYCARLLQHTFYARKDVALLQNAEFLLLNQALGEERVYRYATNVNLGCVLLSSFLDIMEKLKGGRSTLGVYIGGVITVLLEGLGINLKNERQNEIPKRTMDAKYLRGIGFAVGLMKEKDEIKYVYEWRPTSSTRRHCLLPNKYVSPTSLKNLRFEVPKEDWVKESEFKKSKSEGSQSSGPSQRLKTVSFTWSAEDDEACKVLDYNFDDYLGELEACGLLPTYPYTPTTIEGMFAVKAAEIYAKREDVHMKMHQRQFETIKHFVEKLRKLTNEVTGIHMATERERQRASTTGDGEETARAPTGGVVIREPEARSATESRRGPPTGKGKGVFIPDSDSSSGESLE